MSSEFIMEDWEAALAAFLISNTVTVLFGIVTYVLTSIGLYAMAKRRGILKPWLAWIPVGNLWILGSLADQYQYVAKGENRKKRKVLLILKLVTLGAVILTVILAGVSCFQVLKGAMTEYTDLEIATKVLPSFFGLTFMAVPLLGLTIAVAIVRYMALYDVFRSCAPENAVLFLVLSIVFSVTEPFFLFFNRNKDDGMVRQEPPQYRTQSYVSSYQNPRDF